MRARKTIEAQIPLRGDRWNKKSYNEEDLMYIMVELLLDVRDLLKKICLTTTEPNRANRSAG